MTPEELIRTISLHPAVAEVPQPQPERFMELGMVHFRMTDGTGLGINPDLFPARGTGTSEQELVDQVHRHVDEMWQQSITRPPLDLTNVVPIVRDASYFTEHGEAQAARVGTLTDLIGIGMAIDEPSNMRIVMESELPRPRTEFEDFQFRSRVLENFRALAKDMLLDDMGYDSGIVAVQKPACLRGVVVRPTRIRRQSPGVLLRQDGDPVGGDPRFSQGPVAGRLHHPALGKAPGPA